ncbi:MAG TPA: hypothetical protein VHQ01_00960 [Pyrinomonadaceae bacterium]|nr:hypothetical protein [Pyrinomonadaceae bacterium]
MDDKYQISKPKKPQNRTEELQLQIEDLVKLRDKTPSLAEKQKLNAEITKLFAQYERSKI